jgi:hypothetical protein
VRWDEHHRRHDTTAKDQRAAIAKATEIVERLSVGSRTDLVKARGAELIAHYLDPHRRPTRVKEWSERMREEQIRYCSKYVLPVIGDVRCRELQRNPSVHQPLAGWRRCATAVGSAVLDG